MTTAGHLSKVYISADNVTFNEIDGIDTANLNSDVDLLDATNFKDSNNKKRIAGLFDGTVEISGHYKSEVSGQGQVRTLMLAGTEYYFRFLYDGTNGFGFRAFAKSFKVDSNVAQTVKFSASVQLNGPITQGAPPVIV